MSERRFTGGLNFPKTPQEERAAEEVKRREETRQIGDKNRQELMAEIKNVPMEQKQTILKCYEEVYTEFPPSPVRDSDGNIDVNNVAEFVMRFKEVINRPNSGFKENVRWDDREVNMAKAAAIHDVQTNPEKFKDYQRSLEIACADEIIRLWENYENVLRVAEVPEINLKSWLEEGKQKELELIKKYGPLLGEERIGKALSGQAENEKQTDHLVSKLSVKKSLFRMTEQEIADEWFNKRLGSKPGQEFERWIKGK